MPAKKKPAKATRKARLFGLFETACTNGRVIRDLYECSHGFTAADVRLLGDIPVREVLPRKLAKGAKRGRR